MNKRLRKKKRLGEFKEYGFCILAIAPDLETASDAEVDKFCDELILFAEDNGCGVGGCIGHKTDVFYTHLNRGTCTEDDRLKVYAFLLNHPLVTDFKVGPLVDAWHGSYKDYELDMD